MNNNLCLPLFLFLLVLLPFAAALSLPAPRGYVSDFADLILPADEARLNTLLSLLEDNNTVEIAVVTVASLEGGSIDETAVDIFEHWGIGKKGTDNGLLILVAKEEREYRIEVGYGLEGILNDAKVGKIGRDYFVPYFQSDNYGEGIYQGIKAMESLLSGEHEVIASALEPATAWPFLAVALWLFVFILFYVHFYKKRNKKAQDALGWTQIILLVISYFIFTTVFIFMFFLTIILFIVIFAITKGKIKEGPRRGYGHGPFIFGGRGAGGGFGGFGGGMSGGGGSSGRF